MAIMTKLPKLPHLSQEAHRPALFNHLFCDAIINARSKKLPFSVISQILGVSERTIYRWIETGRNLYISIIFEGLDRNKFNHRDTLYLKLYEALHPPRPYDEVKYELDRQIDLLACKREGERTQAAFETANRQKRKRQRTNSQRARDRARKKQERERHKRLLDLYNSLSGPKD